MIFNKAHNWIFLDCDGVLADFDTKATKYLGMNPRIYEDTYGSEKFWEELGKDPKFYEDLDPMPDAHILVKAVTEAHDNVCILTGMPGTIKTARRQKENWNNKHFKLPIICCQSKRKSEYMRPGDIIVDDWDRHKEKWESKKGIWISHKNAEDTIRQLKALGAI